MATARWIVDRVFLRSILPARNRPRPNWTVAATGPSARTGFATESALNSELLLELLELLARSTSAYDLINRDQQIRKSKRADAMAHGDYKPTLVVYRNGVGFPVA